MSLDVCRLKPSPRSQGDRLRQLPILDEPPHGGSVNSQQLGDLVDREQSQIFGHSLSLFRQTPWVSWCAGPTARTIPFLDCVVL